MKYPVGIVSLFLAFFLIFSCNTVDPLKDLPETEYQQAQDYRARIEKWQFAQYDQDDFDKGETAFQAGEANYKKDNLASKASFVEANDRYHEVIRRGIAARRKMSEDEIAPLKERAVSIKADKAAPEEFQQAGEAHEKAVTAANEENWEDANAAYTEAKQKYELAYATAKEKKDKADSRYTETNQEIENLKDLFGMPDTDQDNMAPDEEPKPEDEMLPDDNTGGEDEMLPDDNTGGEDEMLPDDNTGDELPPEDEMPPEDEEI